MRFSQGKVSFAYSAFLGYDMGADGKLVINEEQAAVVRKIYGMFIRGDTYCAIARKLTEEGIPTVTGKSLWPDKIVKNILTNEKYKGDVILQKTYTVDFLNKKVKKRVIFQCNNKFKNERKCSTPHFTENELKELFVKMPVWNA